MGRKESNQTNNNICAPVLLNLLSLLGKSDKMLDKPHIFLFFPNCFDK